MTTRVPIAGVSKTDMLNFGVDEAAQCIDSGSSDQMYPARRAMWLLLLQRATEKVVRTSSRVVQQGLVERT
jgi:hypothetical protein